MPKLSVIIPTRDRADMLGTTIDSVRHAGSDLEIIVVDDTSQDDTAGLCRRYPDVRYFRTANRVGTAGARNLGISHSASEFIAFLDDDDLRLPGTFDDQVALLANRPDAALCYARVFVGDSRHSLPTGAVIPLALPSGDIYWQLLEGNFIPSCSVVVRRSMVEAKGNFDDCLKTMEDYDLWVRLAEDHAVISSAEPVALYRRASSASGQKTSDRIEHGADRDRLQRKMFGGKRARRSMVRRHRALRRQRSVVYRSMVADAVGERIDGRTDTARSYLTRAITLAPLRLRAYLELAFLLIRQNHVDG